MSRLRNVGYMLICRLRTYHMPGAPLAEGNFLRGKVQGLGLWFRVIFLTHVHTWVHTHTNTCANARPSCKPFNAAKQWGSVSNAALDFLARKQGELCRCFRASLNVSEPHSLM